MKYIESSSTITVSVGEWVRISRRKIAGFGTVPEKAETNEYLSAREEMLGDTEPVCMCYSLTLGEDTVEIVGEADLLTEDGITIIRPAKIREGKVGAEDRAVARGELFTLCFLHDSAKREKDGHISTYALSAIYVDPESKEAVRESEEVGSDKLSAFFSRCMGVMEIYSRPERDRAARRVPLMKRVRFPFDAKRDGQDELIRAVYRSISAAHHLLAEAPTGTGKTVSMLYPAVRAMGDGRCDKVFYLTPKTTTAAAAGECVCKLVEAGALLRSVHLSAKERLCPEGLLCKRSKRGCLRSERELPSAVLALYDMGLPTVTAKELREVADSYGVCPHELSLAYSELCDIIISDINYFFDPAVYLRRYFEVGGNHALLIDEAHNLESRAREMFSAQISTAALRKTANDPRIGEHSKLAEELLSAADELDAIFAPALYENLRKTKEGVEISSAHSSELPPELYGIIDKLNDVAARELLLARSARDEDTSEKIELISEVRREFLALSTAAEEWSSGYRLLLSREGEDVLARLFCIDTGKVIEKRLERARSAVFFSATLEPHGFYLYTLGISGADFVSVRSPFAPEALSVSIIDKISTRYSERERTLPAVAQVIAATMAARRGHYMVFAPSFEYAEALHRTFAAKYPKIRSLLQGRSMTDAERDSFLSSFREVAGDYLVGFCVMGGIYSEGIDLAGESLIGAIVVGIGMPSLSYEREAIAAYYEELLEEGKQYAYIYPGMNKVFQAAGRVIRREDDRGVIVLIDDRFADPIYKKSVPKLWRGMQFIPTAKELKETLDAFWRDVDGEK